MDDAELFWERKDLRDILFRPKKMNLGKKKGRGILEK